MEDDRDKPFLFLILYPPVLFNPFLTTYMLFNIKCFMKHGNLLLHPTSFSSRKERISNTTNIKEYLCLLFPSR